MLKFVIDWEDESRVRDRLQRATWARLEIYARGEGGREECLSECFGSKSNSLRRGVYGSVFPLAQWVVSNWWSLLNEPARTERFFGGRAASYPATLRSWLRRHNLLTARNGFALPDLTIYGDEDRVIIRSVPDPINRDSVYPVRFLADVSLRLQFEDAKSGLWSLVEAVAERVREIDPADGSEVAEFLKNWEAVKDSEHTEAGICAAAAAMGLDPYNPDEMTEPLVDLLEDSFSQLSDCLQWDLAETTSGAFLPADLDWVSRAARTFDVSTRPAKLHGRIPTVAGEQAHRSGYGQAQQCRQRLNLPLVMHDLETAIRSQFGWDPSLIEIPPTDGVANRISAFVGSKNGEPRLATPAIRLHPANRRFLLGRALFFAHSAETAVESRLITRATTWSQRASRAFAAELLAPTEELIKRVSGEVTHEEISQLAQDFQVSELVIQHQLDNHNIAIVVDL